MNAVSRIRPQPVTTLADLATAAIAADDAWNAAYDAQDNDALAYADDVLSAARKALHGALCAGMGISSEMAGRVGVLS